MYNYHWDQDTINPQTNLNVIVLADKGKDAENIHPFWYAHVIGIFHAMVHQAKVGGITAFEQMDFLWVWWYGYDTHVCSWFKAR